MPGAGWHPRSRVQDALKNAHTSIQVQPEQPGTPCAMALRLMPCSPRRRIPLASVADGLAIDRSPVGPDNLHQLDTSNGCQDHTVLPSAASSRHTPRPARMLPEEVSTEAFKRRSSSRRPIAHGNYRPATTRAPDAAASTATRPNVRDDGQRPSWRDRTAGVVDLIWVTC